MPKFPGRTCPEPPTVTRYCGFVYSFYTLATREGRDLGFVQIIFNVTSLLSTNSLNSLVTDRSLYDEENRLALTNCLRHCVV